MSETETKKRSIFSKKDNSELTPKQKKLRTAGSWIINILCIVIIIFTLIVAIQTVIRTTNEDGVANLFGTVFMPVKSDSMSGTFEKGDVILGKVYEGNGSDLKVGQVISFKKNQPASDGNEYEIINTHRISRIDGILIYVRGDKIVNGQQIDEDSEPVYANEIVATWGTPGAQGQTETYGDIWKGMGKLSNWLEDPVEGQTRFFLVIVLPLILLFVIYAFVLIRTLVIAKLDKAKAEAAAAAGSISADALSDEDKRRLAEEYLASLAQKGDAPADGADGDSPFASDDAPAPDKAPDEDGKGSK